MNSEKYTKIFIAGPPCSGKSSVGRLLSLKLGIAFHDLDDLITQLASMTIPEIFEEEGEEEFRRRESHALSMMVEREESFVLSLGGGCLLDPVNLESVLNNGIVITLTAKKETLLSRASCQPGARPLAMTENQFEKLLIEREEHYRSLPNAFSTDSKDMNSTVDSIACFIEKTQLSS